MTSHYLQLQIPCHYRNLNMSVCFFCQPFTVKRRTLQTTWAQNFSVTGVLEASPQQTTWAAWFPHLRPAVAIA